MHALECPSSQSETCIRQRHGITHVLTMFELLLKAKVELKTLLALLI